MKLSDMSLSWLVLMGGLLLLLRYQFLVPGVSGGDGYYHTHMANVVRTEGFIKENHWAKYSHWAENYGNKDFLYHAMLVPFTFLPDNFLGTKIAALIGACFLYLSFGFVLWRFASAKVVPIFLLFFFLSDHFLFSLTNPRPMILAIGLATLGIYFLIKQRYAWAFWMSLIYAFLHITAPIMLFFAAVIETVRHLISSLASETAGHTA